MHAAISRHFCSRRRGGGWSSSSSSSHQVRNIRLELLAYVDHRVLHFFLRRREGRGWHELGSKQTGPISQGVQHRRRSVGYGGWSGGESGASRVPLENRWGRERSSCWLLLHHWGSAGNIQSAIQKQFSNIKAYYMTTKHIFTSLMQQLKTYFFPPFRCFSFRCFSNTQQSFLLLKKFYFFKKSTNIFFSNYYVQPRLTRQKRLNFLWSLKDNQTVKKMLWSKPKLSKPRNDPIAKSWSGEQIVAADLI